MGKKEFETRGGRLGAVGIKVKEPQTVGNDSQIFGNDLVAAKVINVDVTMIDPNPYQPRLELDDENQKELMSSIEARGLLQPIVIQKNPSTNRYILVAGQRRLDAFRRLGREVIPAIIKDASDGALIVDALIENIQREDLNPLEIALSIERLKKEKAKSGEKLTYDEIASLIGKDKGAVSKLMSLLKLDTKVQELVGKGEYKVLQVLHLLNGIEVSEQYTVLSHIIKNKLNREDAVAYISALKSNETPSKPHYSFKATDKGLYSFKIDTSKMSKLDVKKAISELEGLIEILKEKI
jgi:ParB family chromosome partitioning protein